MARTESFNIKETLKQLKASHRSAITNPIRTRLKMLILIKSNRQVTQRGSAHAPACSPYSVQTRKKRYQQNAIEGLMKDESGGNKPSKISKALREQIAKRLNRPTDAFRSFKELQQWIHDHYIPGMNYHTVNKYVKRHFRAKLKEARKSHIRKNAALVEGF
jgi:hypothetical protein